MNCIAYIISNRSHIIYFLIGIKLFSHPSLKVAHAPSLREGVGEVPPLVGLLISS